MSIQLCRTSSSKVYYFGFQFVVYFLKAKKFTCAIQLQFFFFFGEKSNVWISRKDMLLDINCIVFRIKIKVKNLIKSLLCVLAFWFKCSCLRYYYLFNKLKNQNFQIMRFFIILLKINKKNAVKHFFFHFRNHLYLYVRIQYFPFDLFTNGRFLKLYSLREFCKERKKLSNSSLLRIFIFIYSFRSYI